MDNIYIQILNEYGFSTLEAPILLRQGIDNDMYTLENGVKKILIRISKRDLGESIIFETILLEKLNKKDIPVSKIIKTKKGRSFLNINGTTVTCFEFIEHQDIIVELDNKPELSIVQQAGKALGQLHTSCLDINIPSKNRRTIYTEVERALKIKNFIKNTYEGGKDYIEQLETYVSFAKEKDGTLKKGVIHNDYIPGNVLFNNNDLKVIVDFDWACYAPLVKDVSLALVIWSLPDNFTKHWEDVFSVFLESYNQTSPYIIKRNSDLFKWICFSCLSDSATYFADLGRENKNITRITQNRRYKKFLYFKEYI